MLRGGKNGEHRPPIAIDTAVPSPAEAIAGFLPQDLEAVISFGAEPISSIQLQPPFIKSLAAKGLRTRYVRLAGREPSMNRKFATQAAVLPMSALGPSRQFAATRHFGRFRAKRICLIRSQNRIF